MKRTAYYSVIQYMPDLGRMEAVNLGVVVWWPVAIQCRSMWHINLRRCRRFFPDADWHRVHIAAKSTVDRLREDSCRWTRLYEFEDFVNLLANDIQMTPPRPMILDDEDVSGEMDRLFRALVAEPEAKP